jgi:hypothetical protein
MQLGQQIYQTVNVSYGIISLLIELEFLGEFFPGFENLITFKCNFKAFRSRIKLSKVLKTHQGSYFHFKN